MGVLATEGFRKDLQKFRSYKKNIAKRLAEFLAYKAEHGMKPLGVKDAPIGFHNKGVWRYHLDHGKVILIYSHTPNGGIELYMVRDHTIMDGQTSTNIIHRYVTGLSPDKLVPFV